MGGRIPEAFIEQLLDRIDIVDIIQRRVPLKPAGREFQARCPFHEEKTPSFTVSPQKQFYHCFGCGEHGSAIGFLMKFEGLEFTDAVADLAHLAGMPMPQVQYTAPPSPAYQALTQAAEFFQQQLSQQTKAKAYLQQRGVNHEMVQLYQIGYAPAGHDLLGRALQHQKISVQTIVAAGLVNEGRDRFRDRIMFPIHDRRGRVIGFGGRALGDLGPKYLNSPETEVFHKGHELYGLYHARQRGRPQRLIVVEGYLDVIALTQAGIDGAVATLGTATTPFQVERLFQTSSEVVYCFDGDNAGRKAAWRALESTLPQIRAGRQAAFLFLPEGEDPDTLVRARGMDDFQQRLNQAIPLSQFFIQQLSAGLRLDSVDGRAQLVANAQPLLEKMPTGVYRDLLTQELSEHSRHRGLRSPSAARPKSVRKVALTPLRKAIAILIQQPLLAADITVPDLSPAEIPPGFELLLQLIDFCRERPHISTAQLLEHWRHREHARALDTLATLPIPAEAELCAKELRHIMHAIEIGAVTQQIENLAQRQAQSALSADEKEAMRALLKRKAALQQLSRD